MSDHTLNTSSSQRTLDSWLSGTTRSSPASRTASPSTSSGAKPKENTRRNTDLAVTAQQTLSALPNILRCLPRIQASRSERISLSTCPPLRSSDCPKLGPTVIKIVNQDTLNAAIALQKQPHKQAQSLHQPKRSTTTRVLILNMANASNPGGGWLKGAIAQEEAICYRTSLSLSLHSHYYPWKQRMGIYTDDVVVIRSDLASGHALLRTTNPADLPIVSVISIAAPRCPRLDALGAGFADPATRELVKDKMRLCLRVAALKGHGRLVLGALGCGAFRNPPREVARCWGEVFGEDEFRGGWWEEVWFAVYDKRNEGNYEVFGEVLGDVLV